MERSVANQPVKIALGGSGVGVDLVILVVAWTQIEVGRQSIGVETERMARSDKVSAGADCSSLKNLSSDSSSDSDLQNRKESGSPSHSGLAYRTGFDSGSDPDSGLGLELGKMDGSGYGVGLE